MFCQNCGKKLRENAKFCSSCGAKIENFDPTQNFLSSVQTENADNLSETVIQHTRYGDSAGNSIVKPYKSNVDLKKNCDLCCASFGYPAYFVRLGETFR